MKPDCEIVACDRIATYGIHCTDQEGVVDLLKVCEPCCNAFTVAARDDRAGEHPQQLKWWQDEDA